MVRREMPLVMHGREGVRLGVLDRLLLQLDSDGSSDMPRVVGASIIDFKTDRPGDGGSEELEAFRNRHRDQMSIYALAVAERYELDPTRIQGFLVRVDDGVVVEVPAG